VARVGSRASAVRDRRRTAWSLAQPYVYVCIYLFSGETNSVNARLRSCWLLPRTAWCPVEGAGGINLLWIYVGRLRGFLDCLITAGFSTWGVSADRNRQFFLCFFCSQDLIFFLLDQPECVLMGEFEISACFVAVLSCSCDGRQVARKLMSLFWRQNFQVALRFWNICGPLVHVVVILHKRLKSSEFQKIPYVPFMLSCLTP
jgi:hypothetical protein